MKEYLDVPNVTTPASQDNKLELKQKLGEQNATVATISPEMFIMKEVVDVAKESIRCFSDYMKCREHEITERHRIMAYLKAINHQIDANKEVCLATINAQFEERKNLYEKANKVLEHATELNDIEMLTVTYNFILNVYNNAPDVGMVANQLLGSSSMTKF